ncbi:hypothetical protein ACGO3R_08465 [Lactococcus lactis]
MAVDFDYQEMLLGNLYLAGNILPENKSIHGKKIIQKSIILRLKKKKQSLL